MATFLATLVSCAGPPGSAPPAPASAEIAALPAASVTAPRPPAGPVEHPITALARAGEAGSRVALGKLGTHRLAFVADEDDRALHTVDLEARLDIAQTPLGAVPSEVVIGLDGRIYVGLRSAASIAILASTGAAGEPLLAEDTLPTASEPVGLTLSPDGATLLVTTGISHTLTAFSLPERQPRFTVTLPREPRSLLVASDRTQAFVAHAAGSTVSAVDLVDPAHSITSIAVTGALDRTQRYCYLPCGGRNRPSYRGATMPGVQGFAIIEADEKILVPQANAWSHVQKSETAGYGPEQGFVEISRIAAIDAQRRSLQESSVDIEGVQGVQCLLPRAVVKHPTRPSLLITCLGIDTVVETMLTLEGMSYDTRNGRTWKVPSGPTAIAVDPERNEAVVFSQFDRALSFLDLHAKRDPYFGEPVPRVQSIPLKALQVSSDAAWSLGRRLFHAAGDRRIARDGRACASCHPDGRDDGLLWSTPHGLRQTPMLAGRLGDTAPYGWEGDRSDLREHIVNTIARRLFGRGLGDAEVDALLAYVKDLPVPGGPGRLKSPAEARGEALFQSGEVGCSRCHGGPALTDKLAHDIQSGGRFDTPSLRFLAGTAPYFHDGSYPTLRALLADTDGRMGHTGQLDKAALADLEAYLTTL